MKTILRSDIRPLACRGIHCSAQQEVDLYQADGMEDDALKRYDCVSRRK